jgi:hypothetical protein
MRLLRSEDEVEGGGAVMALEQLQRLARAWYGDRLAPGWRPRSREESQAVLDAVGLRGDFWRLG